MLTGRIVQAVPERDGSRLLVLVATSTSVKVQVVEPDLREPKTVWDAEVSEAEVTMSFVAGAVCVATDFDLWYSPDVALDTCLRHVVTRKDEVRGMFLLQRQHVAVLWLDSAVKFICCVSGSLLRRFELEVVDMAPVDADLDLSDPDARPANGNGKGKGKGKVVAVARSHCHGHGSLRRVTLELE
jgi:hypothetical protein